MNERRKYFHDHSPRKNVADPAGGSNPQPSDHPLDAHPTEPPRPANGFDETQIRSGQPV